MVLTGAEADASKLPFHPSMNSTAGSISPRATHRLHLGSGDRTDQYRLPAPWCLRGRHECTTNVTSQSHLLADLYQRSLRKGERLPISFAVDSHPLDFTAAIMRVPKTDELKFIAAFRGEPVGLVKSVTNDIRVPADAEMIIEGYLDERGYIEPDGPYGEYMGYYGPMHLDPVFHLTAITRRSDAMHQSLLHGAGKILGHCDSVHLAAIRIEADALKLLTSIGIEVTAIFQSVWAASCSIFASPSGRPARARRGTPSPPCSAASTRSSTYSSSTRTSTSAPTTPWNGPWARASRPIATWWCCPPCMA